MKWKVKVAFLLFCHSYFWFRLRLDFFFALNYLSVFFDSASKNENATWKKSEPFIPKKEVQKPAFKGVLYVILLFLISKVLCDYTLFLVFLTTRCFKRNQK